MSPTESKEQKHQPLSQAELPLYLLYRYNSGGYDDHIAQWRASTRKPDTRDKSGTNQE